MIKRDQVLKFLSSLSQNSLYETCKKFEFRVCLNVSFSQLSSQRSNKFGITRFFEIYTYSNKDVAIKVESPKSKENHGNYIYILKLLISWSNGDYSAPDGRLIYSCLRRTFKVFIITFKKFIMMGGLFYHNFFLNLKKKCKYQKGKYDKKGKCQMKMVKFLWGINLLLNIYQ